VNLAIVADMLGFLSRPKGRDAIISMIKNDTAKSDSARTSFGQALAQMPSSSDTVPSFRTIFDKLNDNSSLAPSLGSQNARQILIQISNNFYDPTLVDWLVGLALAAKTSPNKLLPLDSAGKLMTLDKKKSVSDAYDKVLPDIANEMNKTDPGPGPKDDAKKYVKAGDKAVSALKEIVDFQSKVLDQCKTDAMCYVKVLDEPIPSSPPTANSRPIKAAYMAVIFAGKDNDKIRGELLSRIDKVKEKVSRLAVATAIDELAPNGDSAAADQLDKMADKDKGLGDNDLLAADNEVAKVSLRLRARAMQ
jgi:hypothetical protein